MPASGWAAARRYGNLPRHHCCWMHRHPLTPNVMSPQDGQGGWEDGVAAADKAAETGGEVAAVDKAIGTADWLLPRLRQRDEGEGYPPWKRPRGRSSCLHRIRGCRVVGRGRCRGQGHWDGRGVATVVQATGQRGGVAAVDEATWKAELSPLWTWSRDNVEGLPPWTWPRRQQTGCRC